MPPVRVSFPVPPLIISASVPPVRVSFPAPPEIVLAIFGPVIVSFPVVPLIVTVSDPLVKVPAVKAANVAVVPAAILTIRLDVPAAVSVRERVSAVSCVPVKVAVWLAPPKLIISISSKLASLILTKSVDVMTEIVSFPPLEASVIVSPASTSFVLK